MILQCKTTTENFPLMYLKTLNGTIGLTEKELELTAELIKKYLRFMSQGLQEPFLSKFVFSTEERKSLCESLDGLSNQNLGNKFKQLVDKGVLLQDGNNYSLIHRLIPTKEVIFKFILEDDTTGKTVQEDF